MTTPTEELPPFETRLLAELTDIVEDRRRAAAHERTARPRRIRYAVAGTGSTLVALVLALGPGLISESGSSAFAIRELENGVVELDIFDQNLDADELTSELSEVGIEVVVEREYASPSAVGGVEAFLGAGSDPFVSWQSRPGITLLDGEGASRFRVQIDPDEYDGEVVIHLLVETPPGQPYTVAEEVFEPGEVLGGLHCAIGEPLRAEQLVPYLAELDLDVMWETVRQAPGEGPDTTVNERVDQVPGGQVMWGYAQDHHTVRIMVLPDGETLDAEHWPIRLSDEPCTAEQAAAWPVPDLVR